MRVHRTRSASQHCNVPLTWQHHKAMVTSMRAVYRSPKQSVLLTLLRFRFFFFGNEYAKCDIYPSGNWQVALDNAIGQSWHDKCHPTNVAREGSWAHLYYCWNCLQHMDGYTLDDLPPIHYLFPKARDNLIPSIENSNTWWQSRHAVCTFIFQLDTKCDSRQIDDLDVCHTDPLVYNITSLHWCTQ